MATTAAPSLPQDQPDRSGRRRPFSTWVKKLTNFNKGSFSSSNDPSSTNSSNTKRPITKKKKQDKRAPSKNNNPYPQSGTIGTRHGVSTHNHNKTHSSPSSFSTAQSNGSLSSLDPSPPLGYGDGDGDGDGDGNSHRRHTAGARSLAPTVATDHEAQQSIVAPSSVAGTSRTVGGMESRRGGDSTFSSPAPSVRSLTTTLTTIHSSVPPNGQQQQQQQQQQAGTHGGGTGHGHGHSSSIHHGQNNNNNNNNNNNSSSSSSSNNNSNNNNNAQAIQFHQPFPTTTTPASAIPAHLAPSSAGPGHPTTYSSATANNLLTDNASILTLASSSQRRRRRSLDTDASVRALAPSSLWGGSRESLPLSVLSANVDPTGSAVAPAPAGLYQSQGGSRGGGGGGERNSVYAKQQNDGASMRSGLLGHGRAESISGSIGGVSSPLASPPERNTEKDGKGDRQ
ncbi:hypothetical protein SODALDRAFT_329341 [Sodiomyces alkalinus F11]|uniref:Ca2+-modulated nonselective cation channel polycystin n=1 Tax=Sodiomyces alkalinus (strain CBS 110278 / VKM F-3762 / F11) TaxID=1314773 RepID=A0A3N2PKW6_SODAK|nr:hypothetical protein SODALDRAFT_329341 [Sodiomyces alkalinus F11]ROT35167.1 hypothetical protein SODALDRAFT_329341 [Sodiomyces alkalinus F11]